MLVANAQAMKLAGVDSNTADPPGGTILRNREGHPIGVFRETAQHWVDAAYRESRAQRTAEEIEAEEFRFFLAATEECLRYGITSFQDAGCSLAMVDRYRRYTLDAAYAAFEESHKGSITPGKLADLVVLSKDIMTCPDDEIAQTHVVLTIVGGRVVYHAR
jgi:predicted amidohydrolase YtcJ